MPLPKVKPSNKHLTQKDMTWLKDLNEVLANPGMAAVRWAQLDETISDAVLDVADGLKPVTHLEGLLEAQNHIK